MDDPTPQTPLSLDGPPPLTVSRPQRPSWPLFLVVALVGTTIGMAAFTFEFAEGLSYLSDDPKSCINCHVMNEQYDGWLHGSHGRNATCNDCHVPHDSFISKYMTKAEHGYRHSKGFTFNDFHEPIQITQGSKDAVAGNCVRCHASIAADTSVHTGAGASAYGPADQVVVADCLHCHTRVGHGPLR